KAKIDELPALWNVLRGEMRLVGPRPEVPEYVDRDDPIWMAVLRERPGLTHPVTLCLRNEEDLLLSTGDKPEAYYLKKLLPFKLSGYLKYAQNRTWLSDFLVLTQTVLVVFVPRLARSPSPTEIDAAAKDFVAPTR
ncbi:MAG TPA: hypothetical protein EYO58_00655, partial [Flavobacteriales bacterium]|nr:hypothetical protein [Flavobacteriales bacterium]